MSQWRRVALESLKVAEMMIKESVGIYHFWGMLEIFLNSSYENDSVVFQKDMVPIAKYIDWYFITYYDNGDMQTALQYGFIEHVEDKPYFDTLVSMCKSGALGSPKKRR